MTGGAGGAGGYTEALTVSTGVQNCRLTATMSAGDTVVGVTDEGGYATMEIPTGVEFIVRVQPPDGYLVPDPQTVTMIYGTPQNMTFALIQSAVISVTVTDEKTEGGAGAVGATVKISQNGDVIETKTTDSLAKASFTVAPGTYSITGTAADGETMLSSSEVTVAGGMTSAVTLKVVYNIVYGFSIAVGTADPDARVTYPQTVFGQTNAAYGKTPASGTGANCMNGWAGCELISGIKRQTGSGSAWTDVSDKKKAVAGSASSMVMTYVPTRYMKMTNDGTNIICAFSMEQIDSTWKDYAGSVGSNHVGHFRVGCYVCKSDFKSYTGSPKVNTRLTGFISGCQKLGTGYDIMTWYQWMYLAALAVLLYKSTDLQAAMASGYVSASSVQSESALTFTNDYGMAGTPGNTGTTQMAFFWIQNLWGNMSQFVGGAKTNSSYKLMTCTGYSSTDEADFDKKSLGGPSSDINGAIKTVVGTTDAGFFPTDCSGSKTTYFADYGSVDSSGFPYVGGRFNIDDSAGPFFAAFDYTVSGSSSSLGSRLSYRL